jgi:hypothetical protein
MFTDVEMNTRLAKAFPELWKIYEGNERWDIDIDDTGPHIFYDVVLNQALEKALHRRDKDELQQYSTFIDELLATGDEVADNVIALTVIEFLMDLNGPEKAIAYSALGPRAQEVWMDMMRWDAEHMEETLAFNRELAKTRKPLPWELPSWPKKN